MDSKLFNEFVAEKLSRGNPARRDAVAALLSAAASTPESLSQLAVELQNAVQVWKQAQTSFVALVRSGTPAMVAAALKAGSPDPRAPVDHPKEKTYAITEAARRGNAEIVQALLGAGVPADVCDFEETGGCGVGSTRRCTPLGEALLGRHKAAAVAIARALGNAAASDAGYALKSTFEPDVAKTSADLAREWGDAEVVKAVLGN
eukprot:m51a1_g1817 hypothetical protein (204) ;mRNA; r:491669-492443